MKILKVPFCGDTLLQQQFTFIAHFSIQFHFYFLLRLFISKLKIISSYHFTINLFMDSMAAESFVVQPRTAEKYRRYIGAGWTRSAVDLLKVFSTNWHSTSFSRYNDKFGRQEIYHHCPFKIKKGLLKKTSLVLCGGFWGIAILSVIL